MGFSSEEISNVLIEKGWDSAEINEAFRKVQEIMKEKQTLKVMPPAPSKKFDWSINFNSLSISQIFLYLGGLIVIVAGIIYIGINWEQWGPFSRILAIFIPMIICFGVGIKMIFDSDSQKQSEVFLAVGLLILPLFLSVMFQELEIFKEPFDDSFFFSVSLVAFLSYISLKLLFSLSIFNYFNQVAGLFVYYFFFKFIGVSSIIEAHPSLMAWLLFFLGIMYFSLGIYFELNDLKNYCRLSYFLGALLLFFSLGRLGSEGDLINDALFGSTRHSEYGQEIIGWSNFFVGIFYLIIAHVIEKLKDYHFDEMSKYKDFFYIVGPFWVLAAIFFLGLGGKKPIYETLLLFSSLGLIFGSILRLRKPYLILGTLFLVVYIFSIGGEYFKNKVGWPITLFFAGLISMGISVLMERIKKEYFDIKRG